MFYKGCLIGLCISLLIVAAMIAGCNAILDAAPPMR